MNATAYIPTPSSAATATARASAAVWLILGSLMILSVALSVFFFIHQSLRLDEAQSLWVSSRTPAAILSLVAADVHVPLYYELLRLWRLYIGDSVMSARLMSLFFFVLSLPALYALGALAYSRRVGLIAATFMALSPFMNWYGSEIRMYTLFLFLTILNQYCFIRLWKQPSRDTWIGYGATALFGIFTHYFFFLNLGAQVLFYLTHRQNFSRGTFRRLFIALSVIVIAFIPWIFNVLQLGEIGNQVPNLTIPTSVDVFNAVSQLLFGFQNDNLNTIFLSLWPVGMLIGFLALRRKILPALETRYFLLTLVIGFVVAFAFSISIMPVFVSRYLIFTAPALYLLLAAFLDAYAWRGSAAAVALVMAGMLAIEIVNPSAPVKEDYRDATAYLSARAAPQDVVIVSVPFTLYPVEYYYRGTAPLTTLPLWNRYARGAIPTFSSADLPKEVEAIASDHQSMWLMQSYDQGYNEEVRQYLDSRYRQLEHVYFPPNINLYKYQVRYDTPLAAKIQPAAQ